MLEIPESLTIARQLNDTVMGKRITEVETEHTKHGFAWYTKTPQEYQHIMEGKTVGETCGIGSMVEMTLDEYRFVAGDGTNLRFYPAGEKLPAKYQMRITFADDSSLLCTVQMYGVMSLFQPETYDNFYYQVAKEKPMPCTDAFDPAYFRSLRDEAGENISMKTFLATNQRIPGLGNGVLQDILLESGLHPKQKIGRLQNSDWKRVYGAVTGILQKMIEAGGRDTEKDLYGESGGYCTRLSKKTAGKPCPYCGTAIQKATYLGGTVYFCPECQKMR
ncbi:formamidopyrimidine-DNA glycosylase [Ruminococcus gauvreauii]|uniref:Endonuclease VIII n=1 Tax=Ruminococcus gauvreauii TaxID=438033 RepID=A0ABY5VKC0_9FIRM|nr:formamidopyrimidine-DNA glycosylase [Ruminococcus gauvreauii]UWP60350.1 endonuclease VIII [Ruminococcus gauvreauii]